MLVNNRLYFILLYFYLGFSLTSCKESDSNYIFLEGETMGTFYHIKYESLAKKEFKNEIDSLLEDINNSLSTYIPTSTISRFNKAEKSVNIDPYFKQVYLKAKNIHKITNGAFDPTVMPLVNEWGFGYEERKEVDMRMIDSMLQFVDFNLTWVKNDTVYKRYPQVMLDFSAIAKGFGVDVVSEFIESNRVENYMVEIGGEVRVKGKNPKDEDWQIGIEKPVENESVLQSTLSLNNLAVATSGNYRNFYYKDGKRYAHTINPETGLQVEHNLLSVTVISDNCMTADAYATAFMVMGTEKAIQFSQDKDTSIMVYLIYENDEGKLEEYYPKQLAGKLSK